MTTRRSAREQALPEQEASALQSLRDTPLFERCRDLYLAGWTLRAIGEALVPPRSRSTVRSWIQKVDSTPTTAATDIETPTLKTDTEYVSRRIPSPGITAADLTKIQDLAPIARRYRASMSPLHKAALANLELTQVTKRLHATGVSVGELATAANVTYRAMSRRLGRTK